MPTPSDTYDIEQARSHLDAIYNHVDELDEPAPQALEHAVSNQPQYGVSDVPNLTAEAKSHSVEYIGPKVELVATYGKHIGQLRANMMHARNEGNR